MILANQPPLSLVEQEVVVFQGKKALATGSSQERTDLVPDILPAGILAGMDQGNLHGQEPPVIPGRPATNMVNPISLYTYYCYYG
jgi:hypothetical protein